MHGGSRSITVQAASSDGSTSTRTFTIAINDLNEFSVSTPTDTDAAANQVDENVTIGTTVGITANAFDLDATTNTITYSLTSNQDGLFAIDPTTGVVTTAAAIDREVMVARVRSRFKPLQVMALHRHERSTIAINDLNEFSVSTPTDSDAAANQVDENVAIGTTVGITANAFDLDATTNTITYSLTSNPDGLFTIDPTTGVVTTATAIDREAHGAARSITVQAMSSDGATATRTFNIAINDINEFSVSAIADSNAAPNFVYENSAIGTTVGITAAAADADATQNTVTYSLDSNANGRFSIGASDGVVRVAGPIDFETAGSYQISVRALSLDGSSSTVTYTIVIGDRNDSVPIIAANQVLTVAENSSIGTSLGVATVSDADTVGSLQSWQMVSDSSAGGFTINAATGEITTVNSFNFEQASTFTLTLRVHDGANWSANQTVTIHVLDVNEAPVAAADSFTIRTDQIVSVSAAGLVGNDFDVDGNSLFPVLVTGAANGTVTIGVNGQLTYTPPQDSSAPIHSSMSHRMGNSTAT